LAFDRASVDGQVSEVCEQLLGTILTLYKLEELWSVIDELLVLLSNAKRNGKRGCELTVVQVLPPMNTS
jgi:hypothetical protein